MRSLSLNASKKFSHIDCFVDGEESKAIRIDSFFADQVLRTARALKTAEERARQRLFKGRSRVSFDGTLKVVDHRGAKKLGLLVLTAGGAEIECIYDEKIAANIGSHFDTRCRVEAWAYYDGNSKLPIRLELTDAQPVKTKASLTKWRGAFDIPDEDVEEWAE